jgi:hypothetical protein
LKTTIARRFAEHRDNAAKRGIPFRLTFEQWFAIWEASGKWKQRGTRRGQYCMARPGDRGAYEVGNVTICLNEENRAERNRNYSMKGSDNPAFGQNYWASGSKATNKRRRAAIVAANSKPKSKAMRERLSLSATGRKRVIRDGRVTWSKPTDYDYPGSSNV